jgi:hypothetical protein
MQSTLYIIYLCMERERRHKAALQKHSAMKSLAFLQLLDNPLYL